MTQRRHIFEPHDLRPAPTGWFVWVTWSDDEGENVYRERLPLAGWLIEEQWTEPEWDEEWGDYRPRATGRRDIQPAVWSNDEGLQSLEDLACRNVVAHVVGPGEDEPDQERAAEELRRKIRAYAAAAARATS